MRATLVLATSAALAAATLVAGSAEASVLVTHVTNIFVNQDGIVAFDVTDNKPAKPSCSPVNNDYIFRMTGSTGQSLLAVLLTAKATNKTITVFGSDACVTDGGTEDMTAVVIQQ